METAQPIDPIIQSLQYSIILCRPFVQINIRANEINHQFHQNIVYFRAENLMDQIKICPATSIIWLVDLAFISFHQLFS